MLARAAEESFQNGVAALSQRRMVEALALFETAIQVERRHGVGRIQPRYLSYYGLCLALVLKQTREGVFFCRLATAEEHFNADLHWNLGRAWLAAERRREAYRALQRGLRLDPGHHGIRHELARMGRRRKPALPFLRRSHPLNVLLGKI